MSYSLNATAPGNAPAASDFDFVLEDLLGHQEGGGVAMLFVLHDARDALDALHHLRDRRGASARRRSRSACTGYGSSTPIMRALRMARRMILRST